MDITETVKRRLIAAGDVFSIGKSECGNDILCAHVGSMTGRQIIITAGMHARECYTALVALEQAERFEARRGGAYIIPLVNPDGAAFFESGRTFSSEFLKENLGRRREWKANAKGVDINVNFDARWGTGEHNVFTAGASDYVGSRPFCAAESAALAEFTHRVRPAATVSYHAAGGELYWEFFQTGIIRERDMLIASAIAGHIGAVRVDGDMRSAGGYKDWCVNTLRIPAVTVELAGHGVHPLTPDDFKGDISKNADLPAFLLGLLDRGAYD